MATKLKNHRPFAAFMVYFLSFSAFFVSAALFLWGVMNVRLDYKQGGPYTHSAISNLIMSGYDYGFGTDPDEIYSDLRTGEDTTVRRVFAGEGGNISYLITGDNIEPLSGNTDAATPEAFIAEIEEEMELSRVHFNPFAVKSSYQGYDHLLVIRGNNLFEKMNIRTGTTQHSGVFSMSQYAKTLGHENISRVVQLAEDDLVICLAVRAEGAFTNNYGNIYRAYYLWFQGMLMLAVVAAAMLISLLVFLLARLNRQGLSIAKAKIASFTGWFWVECKALALIAGIAMLGLSLDSSFYQGMIYQENIIILFCAFWLLWLLANDLRRGGQAVFRHNIINSIKEKLLRLESKYPFCARMKRRLIHLILLEVVLALLAVLMLLLFQEGGIIIDLFLVLLGILLLAHYVHSYFKEVDAFDEIVDYTAMIRGGTATEPLTVPAESAFATMAANLNDIHSGMTRMVEDRVRSERMKVELITNVSHDLKTPLTSIINYVDLLGKETLTPDYANDYVKVLEGKSQRLKNLVQDLFEISKANSGNVDLNLEQLSIQSLVEQTVAEQDERRSQASVEIKLQLGGDPLTVRADGKKLHRVFENLLGNALKYSLAGTRVYITAVREGDYARIDFKNVAGYEMTFTAEEIVERFRRGDASRTSEGSGLGLAIAKSFLELNGGSLTVELDGDLFKAIVRLPLYVPYAQRHVEDEPAEQPPALVETKAPLISPVPRHWPFFKNKKSGGVSAPPAEPPAPVPGQAEDMPAEQTPPTAGAGRETELALEATPEVEPEQEPEKIHKDE